jgi:hypothetical protein
MSEHWSTSCKRPFDPAAMQIVECREAEPTASTNICNIRMACKLFLVEDIPFRGVMLIVAQTTPCQARKE